MSASRLGQRAGRGEGSSPAAYAAARSCAQSRLMALPRNVTARAAAFSRAPCAARRRRVDQSFDLGLGKALLAPLSSSSRTESS
jgi:hypothetical protein